MTTAAAITADFIHAPYIHQLREFEVSAELPARALLWQMRTGKSKVTIDTACHLRSRLLIDCVVVIAPNGVHQNWVRRELPRHHWKSIEYEAIAWQTSRSGEPTESRKRKGREEWWDKAERMLRSGELTWFAFNSESVTRLDMRNFLRRIVRRKTFMLVVDESDDFRTPGSKRTKMVVPLSRKAAYRRILTGTVITNSPLAAYSQFELLDKGALGFTRYADFKKRYAVYELKATRAGRQYPKLLEYTNLDELRDRMARWSSVVLREDCEDLPGLVMRPRRVEPTSEQLRLYRELHRQFVIELEDGREVSIGEQAARLNKLQQVMSGFIKDEYGRVHDVPGPNPRLEALSDEFHMSPGKVIVWCQFHEDIDRACARLRADGHEIVEYHGRVGEEDKAQALDAFQTDPTVKGLVGQPKAGGRGVDMSAADEIINYSHTFDAIFREQSVERATEMMGSNVNVTDLVMPGPDPYILDSVTKKIDVADSVAGHGLQEALRRCEI